MAWLIISIIMSGGNKEVTEINIENNQWDVYLNTKNKAFYLGDMYEYDQFIIQEENILQQVFNYIACLYSQYVF